MERYILGIKNEISAQYGDENDVVNSMRAQRPANPPTGQDSVIGLTKEGAGILFPPCNSCAVAMAYSRVQSAG